MQVHDLSKKSYIFATIFKKSISRHTNDKLKKYRLVRYVKIAKMLERTKKGKIKMLEKIKIVKNKKWERSKFQQRWNKQELETKAIIFLASDPKASAKDFCFNEKISYEYFRKKCDLNSIYEKASNIINKKQGERLKVLEKEFEEQGRCEAFDILHLYDVSHAFRSAKSIKTTT